MRRWFWLPFVACTSCDAPFCEELEPSQSAVSTHVNVSKAASSVVETGSARLVGAGDETVRQFVATISNLPELWQPNDTLVDNVAALTVDLRYETPPFGSDGRTQMPQLEVGLALDQEPDARMALTSSFAGKPAARTSRPLFPTCDSVHTSNCCAFGSSECEHALRVRIERLEGTAFPPVLVDWTLTVSARVSDCPKADSAAELDLAEVSE